MRMIFTFYGNESVWKWSRSQVTLRQLYNRVYLDLKTCKLNAILLSTSDLGDFEDFEAIFTCHFRQVRQQNCLFSVIGQT